MVLNTDSMRNFLAEAIRIGERIHQDQENASKIFEKLQEGVDFETLILQNNRRLASFLKECESFALVIADWSENYSKLLLDFQVVLSFVIDDLNEIEGLTIHRPQLSGRRIQFTFDGKRFEYEYQNKNRFRQVFGKFTLESETKGIEREIKDAAQEIAEILQLDYYLLRFMKEIKKLNERYNIKEEAGIALSLLQKKDFRFIQVLTALSHWWVELQKILDKMKEVTIVAIHVEEKIRKKIFRTRQQQLEDEKRLELARSGMIILARMAIGFIPGLSGVQAAFEAAEIAKMTHAAIESLNRAA